MGREHVVDPQREHVVDPERVHHAWDMSIEPALVVESGDTVHFDIPMAGAGQVFEGAPFHEVQFDFDTIYNLLGPVAVHGAVPGDTLEIEIAALEPGEWGWTVILPGLGLLSDEFPRRSACRLRAVRSASARSNARCTRRFGSTSGNRRS